MWEERVPQGTNQTEEEGKKNGKTYKGGNVLVKEKSQDVDSTAGGRAGLS